GPHRVLPDSLVSPARRHRLGAGSLRLREQPRGRNREDAVRPLLHQEPIALAGCEDPAAHGPRCHSWRQRVQRRTDAEPPAAVLEAKRAAGAGVLIVASLAQSPDAAAWWRAERTDHVHAKAAAVAVQAPTSRGGRRALVAL